MNARDKEMESLRKNDFWELIELLKDQNAAGSKCAFKLKANIGGSVECHKAQLIAQGFSQNYSLDYDEKFSPVIRFESFQTVIVVEVQNGLKLHQMSTVEPP